MPIYEYRCTACHHELDALQKMSDPPLQICPNCSQSTLQKCISAVGFRLKGSGWYETDFKGGSKKNIHGDKDKDKDKIESTPKTGTDAATTETKTVASKPSKTETSSSSTAVE